MKRKHVGIISLLVAAGLALCIGAVATQQTAEEEREVSIDQVPAAVKATILAQAGTGTIEDVELGNENGQVIYEADVIIDGQEIEIKVAPDGTLVAKDGENDEADDEGDAEETDDEDDEQEEQVSLADVPEAVKAAIVKEAGGNEIKEIEKETEGSRTIYSAEVAIDGQEVDFEIAPDGTLLGREVENQDDID